MRRPIPQPKRTDIPELDLPAYDAALKRHAPDIEPGGDVEIGGYHGSLLNSPPFADVLEAFGRVVRTRGEFGGTYSHSDREFVDQVLSVDFKTNCVQGTHIPDALAVGVRMEAIEALRYGHEQDLNDEERFLAEYIRAVVNGELSDELLDRMVERLGQRGAVEYTLFITFLEMTMRNIQALTAREPTDAEIDQMIRELKDGTRAVPDFRERIH